MFLIDTGTVNRDANYVTEIGTDSYQAGYYGGYWTAKYMQEDEGKTEVNLINFYNQTEMSSLRVEGFVAGLKEGGLTVNVLNEYLADTREGYMANCETRSSLMTTSTLSMAQARLQDLAHSTPVRPQTAPRSRLSALTQSRKRRTKLTPAPTTLQALCSFLHPWPRRPLK